MAVVSPPRKTPPEPVLFRVRDAALLGLLTFVFVFAYFVYLTRVGFAGRIARDVAPDRIPGFLLGQLGMALGICLICSAVGLFGARRYGLPGVGDWPLTRASLKWTVPVALGAAVVAVFLFDLPFRRVAPGFYPRQWTWALASAFSATFAAEVVARFGMMTIFQGIVRDARIANVAQALFFTLVASRNFALAEHPVGYALAVAGCLVAFLGSLACGWVYARYGFFAALVGHFLYELRTLVLAFL